MREVVWYKNMTREQREALKTLLLSVLTDEGRPLGLGELTAAARFVANYDEGAIRSCVYSLVDEGKVRLTVARLIERVA